MLLTSQVVHHHYQASPVVIMGVFLPGPLPHRFTLGRFLHRGILALVNVAVDFLVDCLVTWETAG